MEKKFQEAEKFRYLILAAQRQGNRILKVLLKDIGVTPSQAEVISVLKHNQPVTLKALGSLLICEEGSPSRLVERMVKEKFVERIREEIDSRYVRLALTDLGNEKYLQIVAVETNLYEMLAKLYTRGELQQTNQMLSKLLVDSPLSYALNEREIIDKPEA